jgi:hypothetical protein
MSISLLAFAVATYGLVDRHRESRRATRRQIADLIDDLNEIQVLHSEPQEDYVRRTQAGWYRALNQRRETLVGMVEALLPFVSEGITSREFAALAQASSHVRDIPKATKFWKEAVRVAPHKSASRMFSLRGQALFSFDVLNDPVDGRKLFEQARDQIPDGTDSERDIRLDTYSMWLAAEHRNDPDSAQVGELLARIEQVKGAIRHPHLRNVATERSAAVIGHIAAAAASSEPEAVGDGGVGSES